MRPIRLDSLTKARLAELDHLYRTAPEGRLRIRALMVLLAAERGMVAAQIAAVVREHEQTVRRWLVRYQAEGVAGLADYLAEHAGIRPSRESVYRLLRAGGVHLSRPQHTITSPDPEYALNRRRSSRTLAITRARTKSSATRTSSTSRGTRRYGRCGAPSASR